MTILEALFVAHERSALRGNCSHHALVAAASGSGEYFRSIAAALLTLGGTHGPLFQAYDMLTVSNPAIAAREALDSGKRVPGWGNGFVRGEIDPHWVSVDTMLDEQYPAQSLKLREVTAVLHAARKTIYPNPAAFTASVAIALGIPRNEIGALFIQGRLRAWTSEYARIVKEMPCLV